MSVITEGRKRRDALSVDVARITPELKSRVLALLSDGATLVEVCSRVGFTSLMPIWRECDADDKFRAAFREAQARGAAAILAEAQENMRNAAEDGKDADKARIAEMYSRTSIAFAEKHAPKEFGSLVKIAGDAELAAVQVSIVKYDQQGETAKTSVD